MRVDITAKKQKRKRDNPSANKNFSRKHAMPEESPWIKEKNFTTQTCESSWKSVILIIIQCGDENFCGGAIQSHPKEQDVENVYVQSYKCIDKLQHLLSEYNSHKHRTIEIQ